METLVPTVTGTGVVAALVGIIGWLLRSDRNIQARADRQVDRAEARADVYAARYRKAQAQLDEQWLGRRNAEDTAQTMRQQVATLQAQLAQCRDQVLDLRELHDRGEGQR